MSDCQAKLTLSHWFPPTYFLPPIEFPQTSKSSIIEGFPPPASAMFPQTTTDVCKDIPRAGGTHGWRSGHRLPHTAPSLHHLSWKVPARLDNFICNSSVGEDANGCKTYEWWWLYLPPVDGRRQWSGRRECNCAPSRKQPHLMRQWCLLMLGVLSRKLTEGEVEVPKNDQFSLQMERCAFGIQGHSARARELALHQGWHVKLESSRAFSILSHFPTSANSYLLSVCNVSN